MFFILVCDTMVRQYSTGEIHGAFESQVPDMKVEDSRCGRDV